MEAVVKKIFDYCAKKYNVEPDFPWAKFSDYAVFRHKDNQKWFALYMTVQKNKLGLSGDGEIGVLNVKYDPQQRELILMQKGVKPSYHMNKGHWVSVLLDGSCDEGVLFELLDQSYVITSKGYHAPKYRDFNLNWVIPVDTKYFDIFKMYKNKKEIEWEQKTSIKLGDYIYMYITSPYSEIRFKMVCNKSETKVDINNGKVSLHKIVKARFVKEYKQGELPLSLLREYGLTAIRGTRTVPNRLSYYLEEIDKM